MEKSNVPDPKVDLTAYNRAAWDSQAKAKNCWSVPVSAEEIQRARRGDWSIVLTPHRSVPEDWFPDFAAKPCRVLCLAGSGGQQAPILAAAGANVTVFDLSEEQLQQDQFVADRDGLTIDIVQGDMRDLSCFEDEMFDLIVHPCSNSFVPNILPVWREAARVLRAEEQARRAAEKLAMMQGLPAPPDEMPQWFQTKVQCYYGLTYFLRAVEAEQRPLREAAEEQMMQNRKKCRQCREEGHKPRGYMCKYSCHEHWQPEEPDARALALIEERLRDEYAGEAASDALEWKAAEDRRKEQQRVDEAMVHEEEAARERLAKDAIRLIAPERLKCVDCQEEGFSSRISMINVISAHSCLVMMCDAHAKACELVQARALRC